ncbi:MAG TPA: metal-dependent hydrolase [Thermoplasmata archaeon]|nr:metal-dependent hydrolase [Thermoplasmata archaeon]
MDLFTHVIFAYLLSFVLWGPAAPQYIAAGALAGGLPDADILLFPLTRWFPRLHHRGIVHTVLGVTVIAAVGSVLVPYLPYFTPASTWLYFVAMEVGGLSHLVLDGFTNYAVAPLEPFSRRTLKLDADLAVNLVTIVLTAGTLVVLIAEHGTVPFNAWVETVWILIAVYGGYLLLRGVARWRAGLARRREGYGAVLPSASPWRWLLVDEADSPDRYRIRFRAFELGGRPSGAEHALEVRKVPTAPGPVDSAHAALERTYLAAMAKNEWLAESYHAGAAIERADAYEVFWFMIGASGFRRAFGVRGTIDRRTGATTLHSGFLRIPREARAALEDGIASAPPAHP